MAGKSPYTQEQLDRIRDMFMDGITVEEIASEIGCCTSTAMRWIRHMGLAREKPKTKRILTPEQKRFIQDNHETMTIRAMASELGIAWATVQARMREMGPPCRIEDDDWTEQEVAKLRSLAAAGKTREEIAEALGRSGHAVYAKARKTGVLVYQPGRKWRVEEIDYLRRNWGRVSVATIAKNVHRDVSGVVQKAHRLRLPPVYNNSEDVSLADFCRATGISRDRVLGTLAPKHGFPLLSKKYGKMQYYHYVDFESILDWMERHQVLYDATEIEDGFFVPEPDWLRAKRRADREDKDSLAREATRRWWTIQEIDHAKLLRKMGYSIEQIAEKLGRTPSAVRMKLVQADAGYTLPMFWSGKDFRFIRDNWETMSDEELAAAMDRPVASVATHRLRMGLRRRPADKHGKLKDFIRDNWKSMSDREMADAWGTTRKTVANVRVQMRLLRGPGKK